ncbi:maintenance of mitochondrial morphology protein 1 [Hygrophoropsis aurantiaca]|uniref:Maintenance of mitochondrial morphology protein 1 n=1 Tax=Hygrophoropsis aurantiaca TaxID=72124 RepID=A0ACB8AQV3_9AGAM|nr:maintenance of mitochondrial morphology protein 1 [Hygrophoropsis aurantiaca]
MGNNYLFSLTPTFTQGLVIGQLSIFILLALVLKYLFLVSAESDSGSTTYYSQTRSDDSEWGRSRGSKDDQSEGEELGPESARWFNGLAHQVAEVYRAKLRDHLPGFEGNEAARKKIEDYANAIRPRTFLDHITVHSVDLGVSAPQLSAARLSSEKDGSLDTNTKPIEFDMAYTDSASISISTAYLFNYPMSSFARLPISLTISLSLFESTLTLLPPSPNSAIPTLTIALPSDFTLNLKTTSLMGSRAMLKDVPKLHELIEQQVRRTIAAKGTWKIVLPGLGSVADAKEEIEREETKPM